MKLKPEIIKKLEIGINNQIDDMIDYFTRMAIDSSNFLSSLPEEEQERIITYSMENKIIETDFFSGGLFLENISDDEAELIDYNYELREEFNEFIKEKLLKQVI